jgi:hypothetical protein
LPNKFEKTSLYVMWSCTCQLLLFPIKSNFFWLTFKVLTSLLTLFHTFAVLQ